MPRPKSVLPWLLFPCLLWVTVFLIGPLLIVTGFSVLKRGPYGGVVFDLNIQSFLRSFDPLYLRILLSSFQMAALTTFLCVLLGFPLAYTIATAPKRMRNLLLTFVMVPFWTNFIIRVYSIKLLFSEKGLAGLLTEWLGVTGTLPSVIPVTVAMVINYLPFLVLPLYVCLEKLEFVLVEAAQDLGARPWQVWTRVILPQSLPGLVAGSIFVFTPALGEFVIPDLLGGAQTVFIGNVISEQFLKTRDWPFGSALTLVLLGLVSVFIAVGRLDRVLGESKRAVG